MKNCLYLIIAAILGALIGCFTVMSIVTGLAEIILSSVFNIYYATLFFIVGSYYSYKIIKKNQIQMSLDSDSLFGISEIPKIPTSGTGGSAQPLYNAPEDPSFFDGESQDEAKPIQGLYQRPPLITETRALYQQSYILSAKSNNNINRLNSSMEILLTLCVFASSFLVLSIEKFWWASNSGKALKLLDQQNQSQKALNLLRLITIASSISFFLIITLLDVAQNLVTLFYMMYQTLATWISSLTSASGNQRKHMSDVQIQFNSQLVVSNIQMFVLLITICSYGIVFGSVQANLDPENKSWSLAIAKGIDFEVKSSEPIGILMGVISAFIIEYMRQVELEKRPKGKYSLEQQLSQYSHNYETTEGQSQYDDEEERVSLVPIAQGPQNPSSSEFILKTDSDEDDDEADEQLLMRATVDSSIAKF